MENPYAPPRTEITDVPTPGATQAPQFSPNQVALATLIGSVIAGALLIAANERAKGNSAQATQSFVVGVGVTAAILALAFILPENFPGVLIPLATTLGARGWSQIRMRAYLEGNPPPPPRNTWLAVAAGVGCLVGILLLLVALAYLAPSLFPS